MMIFSLILLGIVVNVFFLVFLNFVILIGVNVDSVMIIKFWIMGLFVGIFWVDLVLLIIVVGIVFLFFFI